MSAGAFNCDICNMVLNCHQQYMQHKAGKKHLAKAKLKGMAYSSESGANPAPQTHVPFQQGFNQDTLAQITGTGAATSNGVANSRGVSDPVKAAVVQNLLGTLPTKRKAPVIGECDMCGVIFNSKDQEAMHMNGKKHAKKMKMSAGGAETEASFFCSFCNVKLNSIEQLEQHREGSKHQKKVGSAKKAQDETRMESKLPKLETSFNSFATPAPPPPGGIPPPPAALESMKTEK